MRSRRLSLLISPAGSLRQHFQLRCNLFFLIGNQFFSGIGRTGKITGKKTGNSKVFANVVSEKPFVGTSLSRSASISAMRKQGINREILPASASSIGKITAVDKNPSVAAHKSRPVLDQRWCGTFVAVQETGKFDLTAL